MGLSHLNEWEQWCFNSAVDQFGSEVSAEVEAVKSKNESALAGKRENVLRKFLGIEQKFRSLSGGPAGSEQAKVSTKEPPFRME